MENIWLEKSIEFHRTELFSTRWHATEAHTPAKALPRGTTTHHSQLTNNDIMLRWIFNPLRPTYSRVRARPLEHKRTRYLYYDFISCFWQMLRHLICAASPHRHNNIIFYFQLVKLCLLLLFVIKKGRISFSPPLFRRSLPHRRGKKSQIRDSS